MLKKDLIKKVKDLENTVQKLRLAVLHNTSIVSNYTKQILIANATIDKLENESSVIVDSTINEDINTDINTNTIKNVYSTIQEYRRIVSNLTPIVDFDYKINNVDDNTVKRQMKKGYVGIVSDIIDDSDSVDIETPIFDFSLTKVVNKLSYCNPELVNGILC